MKEFDLRPFGIKKPKVYYYKVWIREPDSYSVTGLWDNYGLFNSLSDAEQILERTFQFLDGKEHSYQKDKVWIERCEDIVKSSAHEWKWEDIKVGWFFKCSDDFLYWKFDDEEFRSLGTHANRPKDIGKVEFCYYFDLGTNLAVDPDLKDCGAITNVYECPGLAKILMIDTVIT